MPDGETQTQTSTPTFPDVSQTDPVLGRAFYKAQPDPMRAYAERNPLAPATPDETTDRKPDDKPEAQASEKDTPAAERTSEGDHEEHPEKKSKDDERAEKEAKAEPTEESTKEPEAIDFADLAEAISESLNVKPEQLADLLMVTVKGEDGKQAKVTLSEALKGQLRDADYRHKTMQHADKVKTWEAEAARKNQAIEQRLNELGTIATMLRADLYSGLPSKEEYDRLRARVAADVNDYEAREQLNAVHATLGARQQKLKAVEAQLQRQQREQYEKLLQQTNEGRKKLIAEIPELKDSASAAKFATDMTDYLTMADIGYTPEEVKAAFFSETSLYDARHVRVIRDAMKWRAAQKKAVETRKAVEALPKFTLKPGSSDGRPKGAVDLSSVRDRLRKSASFDDYMALQRARGARAPATRK